MNKMNTRKAATLATILLMAVMGCQSESPTEPSTGGGSGGSTPPTSDIAITLTASNSNPVAGSSTVITARATTGGNNVVDGTAIEFATTFGTFTETGEVFALRTTSNGAATVTLTSSAVGTAQVTARLGSVSRTITITFKLDGGGGTGPTLSSVTPASGPPAGGQVVTITGTNLKSPVRVFFGEKEATVVSSTETQIKAITPAVNLGASAQSLVVDVRVITESGSSNEGGATLANGYRYELEILTPSVTTLSPTTGPNEGNTRITIFGEGFQSPVKVFFGSGETEVEVEVTSVTFSQIQAITPPAAGLGSEFINSSVSIRVLNVASNKQVTYQNAFRYGPEIQITGFQPTSGSHLGGDRITIFGFGFDDPVAVSIGGVAAQVVRVSGTEIIAITSGLLDCGSGSSGTVEVTNLEQGTGDNSAESDGDFTYIVTTKILGLSPLPLIEGGAATITISDPGSGNVKFTVDGKTVFPNPASATNPSGVTTFTIVVPTGFDFDQESCLTGGGVEGERNSVTDFDVVFENILTGCSTDISVPVAPLDTTCVTAPAAQASPATGSTLAFGSQDDAAGPTASQAVTITNIGGVNVTVSTPAISSGEFILIAPPVTPAVLGPGASITFNVAFDPTVDALGAVTGTLTISTTGGDFDYDLTGTGT